MSFSFTITAHIRFGLALFWYDGGRRFYLIHLTLPFFHLDFKYDWGHSHFWDRLNFWNIYISFYPLYKRDFTFNKIYGGKSRPKEELDF